MKGEYLKPSSLAEGALLAAVAVLIALLGLYIPLLGIITNFLWTIPIIILCIRQDMRTGLLGMLVTALLLSIFATPYRALIIVLQYGGAALVYGYALRNHWSFGKTLFYGSMAAIGGTIGALGLFFALAGFSPLQFDLQGVVNSSLQMYRQMGVLEKFSQKGISEAELRQMVTQMVTFIQAVIPAYMLLSSLANALLSLLLSRKILQKLRIPIPKAAPFSQWKLPWYFIWPFILGLGAWLFTDYLGWPPLKTVGQNIVIFYFPIFTFIGIAVVKYYFQKIDLLLIKLGLILLAVFNLPVSISFLILLGMFDTVLDYRRLGKSKS
ncbi:YybS family protein [Bacillota bacterium LX-D]|nr:YybS family protein [Bacillota bacterium LX-D]